MSGRTESGEMGSVVLRSRVSLWTGAFTGFYRPTVDEARALDAVSSTGPHGYDTNNDTKQESSEKVPSEVVEKMVELVGIEPTTSSLRTMRSPS